MADTYFELKYLDESIKVMDASVKRYQELLRLIEAKYEFGKVASVEPLQAQQSLLSARNSLLDLHRCKFRDLDTAVSCCQKCHTASLTNAYCCRYIAVKKQLFHTHHIRTIFIQ